jgi:EmrB/QacA subfamily drug resistance transporter
MTARAIVSRRVVTPRSVLAVASLGAVLAFVDATIVNVAFPDIRESFPDATLAGISWVLNAYNIVFAAFIVAAGRMADLLGRKRLFEFGIVLFTVASGLCALAPSVGSLVAARMVQAIGAALTVPTSLAIVLEAFPGPRRTHGVALWSATAAIAAGLGPSLGGVLVELGGWRLAFLVNLPIGAFALWASQRTLTESRAPGRRTIPDLPGALLLALATGALTLGIVKGNDWGWSDPATLLCFASGAALGVAFVDRCRWHDSPMIDLALLRIRSLAAANALTVIGAAGYFSYVLCNVLFLTTVWRYSVLQAGLAITPGPFVAAAVARPSERLAHRFGPGRAMFVGALIWAAGVTYLVTGIGTTPDFLGQWLPAMAVLGVGAGITFPLAGSTAVAEVTGGRFATATGLNSVARQLGAVLGVALLVAIVGTPTPAEVADAFDRGWTFAAACFLAAAVVALAVGPVTRPADEEEPSAEPQPESPRPAARATRGRTSATVAVRPPTAPPARTTAEFLAGVPMFAGLRPETIDEVAARAQRARLRAGHWLFRQGDRATSLYVVLSGRLEVIHESESPELLRVIGPEAVVGELALVADSTRSASIRALRDSELLELTRAEFDRLVAEVPGFGVELMRLMGTQLQSSRLLDAPSAKSPVTTLVVVPAHDDLPVEEICGRLVEELALAGSVIRLNGPTQPDLAAEAVALDRLDQVYDHLVLLARPGKPWADFCLRHADRVAVIAGDREVPGEIAARPELRGCFLLFAHSGTGPGRLADWLDALAPRAHHNLRPGDGLEPSIAAAARRLAGRSVGLVLSGGGARAFAHIGVIEELLAAGVRFDRVGGVSMGAFIGAFLAAGMEPGEIDARCHEEWVRRNPLNDYRVPRHSLIRGDKVRGVLRRNLPGAVEELPLDYYCTSGDLLTAELVVHRRGSLWEAVGASMNLPGLVPPSLLGDRMLVDGGVLNNLPVETMAAAAEGPIVAVDVTQRFEAREPAPTNNRRRRRRDESHLPGFTETLTRALMLASVDTSEAARRHADLVITPPNEGVGLLEFHQLDRMRDAGRRAALEALERCPEKIFG